MILCRLGSEALQRFLDSVFVEAILQRRMQIDVALHGVPMRIEILGIDRAVREIPRVREVRIRQFEIDVGGVRSLE